MTSQDTTGRPAYGVHSEVGRLRKVLVCAPGLAHRRLTPTNADDLLFDDVMWVENAQRDHADFVNKMRERGVDVVELHDLLARTMALPVARDWLLDRKITPNEVGIGLVDDTRAFLETLEPARLATFLIGGLATADLPEDHRSAYLALARESTGVREYLMPPLPNTLYTRDTTCWLYEGLTLNPLYWPARHDETLLMKAIYTFHPDFAGSTVWWGDPERDWREATFEGGDIMPVGNGVVLMGMSERTSRQAITQVAAALFENGAAEHVIVAGLPKLRSAMHLDTVFTFADRDLVTLYPTIMDAVRTFSLRPSDKPPASNSPTRAHAPSPRSSPRPSDCPNCGSWRRAGTCTPPSGSSGTAATTRSRWNRAWWSPTTATPRPTPCCARPGSRSSPSSAPSWGVAGAAATA